MTTNNKRRPTTIMRLATLAATALLLPAVVHAADPDCQLPDAPPYTGYSLKTGTGCSQYVYCTNGVISSWLTCPNELLFNGAVGEGGICDWASTTQCREEAGSNSNQPETPGSNKPETPPMGLSAETASGEAVEETPVPEALAAASAAAAVEEAATTPEPTPEEAVVETTTPEPVPQALVDASQAASQPMGFCGVDLTDAKNTCQQPCTTSNDCCSPLEACFPTGSSCAASNYSGSKHYFCGVTWCDAASTCRQACPTGTDEECPGAQGCFADVPCEDEGQQASSSTTEDASMSFLNGNANDNANDNVNSNPDNYFCGSNPLDAAEQCKACPGGTMLECGDDFKDGCFKGIDACAGTGTGNGPNSGNASSNSGSVNTQSQSINDNMASINDIIANSLNDNLDNMVEEYEVAISTYQNQDQGQGQDQPAYQTNQPQFEDSSFGESEPAAQTVSVPASTPVPTLEPTLPPWTNAPFAPSPTTTDKTVIGYYAGWQWYDRNKFADPQNIDFGKYDRVNYAFFQPSPTGNLYGTDEWGDPQLLWGPYLSDTTQQFMSGPNSNYFCSWDGPSASDRNCNYHEIEKGIVFLAHEAGVEVWPSIGGWTLSDNFPVLAADEAMRDNFAQQCVDLIDAYGFDGIDIDWEYPGYEDHSGTPGDTINFTLLLRAVRTKLDELGSLRGRFYGLTAALPCGPDKIEKIQVDQIKDILTEFNLMSYDMHGAWDVLTGTNAPMVDQGWTDKTKRWSVHGCVNNYVDLGVPLSKMNIGLPFYGRSFVGATGMKQFHDGADDINWHLDEGSPQYFNIVNELSRMTTYRHENTQTQYATFNTGGLVSYDDPRAICDKVAYANERGLNGFLIWEISGDMIDNGDGTVSTPLIDATNDKIQDPDYDCSILSDPSWALSDTTYRYAPAEPDSVDWSNYVPPVSTGSVNDFNGAQAPRPAPTPTSEYDTPTNTVYNPESSPGNPGDSEGNPGNNPSSEDCPLEFTGYYATSKCTKYVYCSNGSVVGASQPCVPGTLFDVTIGVCTWADDVHNCGAR